MNKRILLIDDDKDEFELFIDSLHEVECAYDCIFAQTAEQALNLLCYTVPNFIFIDYDMPKIDGLKCLSKIKLLISFKNIPIILYSNNITHELSRLAISKGATLCIDKADRIYTLTKLSNHVLANHWKN